MFYYIDFLDLTYKKYISEINGMYFSFWNNFVFIEKLQD